MNIRTLKANEIDVRVGSINEKGATLLLYKDARVDMNILDEIGEPWKREHQSINGKLFCTVSIWNDEIKEWVPRQDVGVESNTEATKGEASDSFKRACFNWGIGRELYTAPFTWISADKYSGYINRSGKPATYDKFSVVSIGYDDNREITELVIKNDKTGRIVFTLGSEASKTTGEIRDRVEEAKQGSQPMGSYQAVDPSGSGQTHTVVDTEDNVLKTAKQDINEMLEAQDYVRPDQKKAFIKRVLQKETIDSIDDAHLVADELDNLK